MSHHKWSGWPGAFCLLCGADDMGELAIAGGALDPYTGEWESEEAKKAYEQRPCTMSLECYFLKRD